MAKKGQKMETESKTMRIKGLIDKAKDALVDATGFKTPRGIGAKKAEKEWVVRVEITEKSSIPEAMDLLGIYDIRLDEEGNMLGYERKGLRKRGDTEARESTIES